MKQRGIFNAVTGMFFVLFLFGAALPGFVSAYEIDIDVSPNVLNIGSSSTVVTVHTDIAYHEVLWGSVTLNGVAIDWYKADDRGYFVAKFMSDDVKALDSLIIGEYNSLVLNGTTILGEAFTGAQDIMVIHVDPQGK